MLTVFEKNELKGFELAKSINAKKQDETYMNMQFRKQLKKFQAVKNAENNKVKLY